MFSGAIVAIITPFKDGKIDEQSFRNLINFQIDAGVSGIVPCGTTGESATLTHEEHERVIDICVAEVGGRVPVIAGTGSNSTAEAIRLTRHAKEAGADAALLITPYYNKPTQKGLYEHYAAVAAACDIPQVLYNVPGRTGVNMSVETITALAKIDVIVGIKEASGDLVKCSYVVRDTRDDFCVLSGEDALNLPILCVGGTGAISVTANVLPGRVSAMMKAWFAGDEQTARKIHFELLEMNDAMFIETNPIPVKTALALMGKVGEEFKLPLCAMTEGNRKKLAQVLEKYGCIG
ncbi:MAG: 4-hydroxy-tetrahydrodipicolinate synthase [Deltaproteobacteria bacterium ADurb.BinA179]|jgi:4-hydroxy-tetrahydrodipicolinate synthase|nr:4-hydroxy-tetrahydrodipicolinate synthase [Deltaproteobacteria bacterium]MDI9543026.1 4-hydroxy-tetrahydrodipicolinate synthase [Pseudomonadota bacterium]NLW68470.1 4-hydroxy-tetrahydrodipicolinate synthase [Bacteriovoracaceae bacterium]OPZ28018.1 MAG: 4-hydroxy-tetrahydrodipicolinate synthase [Deltaproteobacteria bacterium ADurb.BinA179]HRR22364.1 4-hydroxy-tetrahydrodipicolinate synthase [Desulfomonilia bacterium]